MPSSFSASLRFELQFSGENINLWGEKLSNTLARVDDAVAGYTAIAVTGDYSLTSSNDNSSADEARRAHLKFTGTLAANSTITIPAVSKSYWIWNATNKTLTFTTGSGTTSTVEAGDVLPIWSDGANVKTLGYGVYNLKDYIAAQTASAGAVPGTTGHLGKTLKVTVDGAAPTWQQLATTDLSDYLTNIKGLQLALAVSL
jgi:hypothetical protein